MRAVRNTPRVLFATTMMMAFAIAHAAGGFTVTPAQEALIKKGMTVEEVQQALGQPSRNVHYRNELGATWTYAVVGGTNEQAVLDVDFAANGTVSTVGERILPTEDSFTHLHARHAG